MNTRLLPLAVTLSTLAVLTGFATWMMSRSSRADTAAACPDPAQGEKQEDCPWAGVARQMIAESKGDQASRRIEALLKNRLPALDRSLQQDAHRQGLKGLWGHSVNFDEHAQGIIVDPAIIRALSERFGNRPPMLLAHVLAEKPARDSLASQLGKTEAVDPAGHPIVHAGLEHTYGYLFSVLKTPFGFKRARWVEGEIERGFGLKEGLLGPTPSQGSLFSNVTWFAGHIAFRGDEKRIAVLNKYADDIPAELRDFKFNELSSQRLEETVEAKDSSGDMRKVVLRTDFVAFLHPQKDTHWLVYSVDDPTRGGRLLITAFPVDSSFVAMATDPKSMGEGKPVQTRYNGYVEGVTGANLTGTRKATP